MLWLLAKPSILCNWWIYSYPSCSREPMYVSTHITPIPIVNRHTPHANSTTSQYLSSLQYAHWSLPANQARWSLNTSVKTLSVRGCSIHSKTRYSISGYDHGEFTYSQASITTINMQTRGSVCFGACVSVWYNSYTIMWVIHASMLVCVLWFVHVCVHDSWGHAGQVGKYIQLL